MRITRMAESFFHQGENIEESEKGKFPIVLIKDAAHHSFMNGTPSKGIQENDLSTTLAPADAFNSTAVLMTTFVNDVLVGNDFVVDSQTTDTLGLFITAMKLEGAVSLKPPCNEDPEVNPELPTCLHGSPWVKSTGLQWVGSFTNKKAVLVNDDNFHPADQVVPYHHPDIFNNCTDEESACVVKHISITENVYNKLDETSLGKTPLAANEMRVKMKSSQVMHQAAGEADASYEDLDLKMTECQSDL